MNDFFDNDLTNRTIDFDRILVLFPVFIVCSGLRDIVNYLLKIKDFRLND